VAAPQQSGLREGNMDHRWLAHERSRHRFASSARVITLRVLIITLPVLVLAVLALVIHGTGDAGTPDLAGLMFS